MKATDLLKEQHQEIDELFERISLAESGDMSALRSELAATLVAHTMIEQDLFYPATREALGGSFKLQTAFEEHALINYALQKLLSTNPGDESFHARVSVLKDLVQRHVEEEEHDLLKQAESAMNVQQLEELGARMRARFDEVRRHDVEALLAREVAKSMPAQTRRAPGAKSTASTTSSRKAPAKRPTSKRAPASRAEPARAAASAKGRRGAAAGRKKAAAPAASSKSGRAAPSGKAPARSGGSSAPKTSRTGRKGGRANAAPAR